MENQPKPDFTLQNLNEQIDIAFTAVKQALMIHGDRETGEGKELVIAVTALHELLAIINRKINDNDSIAPAQEPEEFQKVIASALGAEKVAFHVAGVQLIEYGRVQGTSLYSTMIKAKKISAILNKRFAELKVQHEAKILNYPVY